MFHPKVQILMSIYRPNIKYLTEQLQSIDEQTYQNLELVVYNDDPASPTDSMIFERNLTNISWRFLPGRGSNLGYEKAFQYLIEESDADYLFFCDQDDVWLPSKIEKCVKRLVRDGSLAIVTDRALIDENGEVYCSSVRRASKSPSELWNTGDDIAKYNLFIPYALGMSMGLNGRFARSVMPVSDYTGHDKWLISCASAQGIVSYIDQPLVLYRRHGRNVSGILRGIDSKADYYRLRPESQHHIILDFLERYPEFKDKDEVLAFSTARISRDICGLYRYRYLAPEIAWFEIVLKCLPSPLFSGLVKAARILKQDR